MCCVNWGNVLVASLPFPPSRIAHRDALVADGRWVLVEEMARQLAAAAAAAGGEKDTANCTSQPITTAVSDGAPDISENGPRPGNGCVHVRPGYTQGLSFMAHMWEPLRWQHRPLAFYAVIELLHWGTWGALTALGLRTLRVQGMTVYHTGGRLQGDNQYPAHAFQCYQESLSTPSKAMNASFIILMSGRCDSHIIGTCGSCKNAAALPAWRRAGSDAVSAGECAS
jgi:hypothetical protein